MKHYWMKAIGKKWE